MITRPVSFSHGWTGTSIEFRLRRNLLNCRLPWPRHPVFHAYHGENLKLDYYTKRCLIQYEGIIIHDILILFVQCISIV